MLVEYHGKSASVSVIVVKNGGPPLLGRNFLHAFGINLANFNYFDSSCNTDARKVVDKFPALWDGSLGCFKKAQAKLRLKEGATPKFCKPRLVPLAIQEKVEREIEKLVKLNVLEPVDFCEWATPIVPVLKKDGGVRICGDFKVSVNPNLWVDKHPLPRIEDIFSKLHGGQEFTKLDLTMAYQQIELEPASRKLTTIATTRGLFQYTRLIYGLSSTPAIFQKLMEGLLMHLEGVVVFLDDILITAPNRKLHMGRVESVLNILQKAGLKLAKEKCSFFSSSVEYLGHIIDKHGLHTNPKKVREIENIAYPKNVKESQAFLGVVNFYRRFLHNVASIGAPLYELLKKDVVFQWSDGCSRAVDELKVALKADTCLAHFNPTFKTKLTVDASPVGVGAVLSQISDQGEERPIEFASRKLSDTEQRYSQLDREAVAILYGVKKFHHFLYGRHFTLVTDKKPLHHIFNPKKGIPLMAASRLQRIAPTLSGYSFDIAHIKSATNIADFFSRYPGNKEEGMDDNSEGVYLNYVEGGGMPVNLKKVQETVKSDALLQKVIEYVNSEWPRKCEEPELRPYFDRSLELSIDKECLFWGYRLVIPKALQTEVVEFLHDSHMGISEMKAMARECCWWPGQGKDLEDVVKSCESCLMTRASPPKQELVTWKRPKQPWSRIHVDFFGPFMNRWCLVIVDSYPKWVECVDMGKNTTSKATIDVLKNIFARFGLPETLVSDNGTAFVSQEFQRFLQLNGIQHSTTPVGQPATNGLAENTVKTFKSALKRGMGPPGGQFNDVLSRFLLDYRNAAHCSTGVSPAQLMFSRQLRTRLDLLNPKRKAEEKIKEVIEENVIKQQNRRKKNYRGSKINKFKVGEQVIVKDFSIPGRFSWTKAIIVKALGKQIFLVKTNNNAKEWKRHANQIIPCKNKKVTNGQEPEILSNPLEKIKLKNDLHEQGHENSRKSPEIYTNKVVLDDPNNKNVTESGSQQNHRYNLRNRKQSN
ncbi:uncharacterized protein K02A2.6-like [Rhagoletis pomonella]|uniref:uncharacterized protein K02A2.6-like n=1 Tax=Rhagoletis pomonella TaxID=28610 RepID=UPI00178324C6|nr:uncharacterized protein K02A2.6-like [Rhagoletis pomonella]